MKILKFGGPSLATLERLENVVDIIIQAMQNGQKVAVVISAFNGVTDELISMAYQAAAGEWSYTRLFVELEQRHTSILKKFVRETRSDGVLLEIKAMFEELGSIMQGIFLVREVSPRSLDSVMSFGERFAAFIMSMALRENRIDAEFLDARTVLITDDNFGMAHVDFAETNEKIQTYFDEHSALQVITGFIGASAKTGETTILGRGGSDYTAAIFAAALNASAIEIWTDSDGVMTADPKLVPDAFSLHEITYEEALELSHFGAKVIYPPTIVPAVKKNIPLVIKNSLNPDFSGTIISNRETQSDNLVTAISAIREIALISLEGTGMLGVAGISRRFFGALASRNISVVLITQASSEHSICCAINPAQTEEAKRAVDQEFALEIEVGHMQPLGIQSDCAIIAVVGKGIRVSPGVPGRLFQALGNAGINIAAIAQGSSELNISLVVAGNDLEKALGLIHTAFFGNVLGTPINIFLVGVGLIGSTLLKQLAQQIDYLRQEYALEVRVVGISNSQRMIFQKDGLPLGNWHESLENSRDENDCAGFMQRMINFHMPNSVFVDCTASDEIVDCYLDILRARISIVTPNKKANSRDMSFYRELRNVAQMQGVLFDYETNVGAALPVIYTLRDLVSTGDQVLRVEAILSGTMSYIFNSFDGTMPFSQIVHQAQKKGYTEPDPRDDLNGKDVARKLLILAREAGAVLELPDVRVESLVSAASAQAATVEGFFQQLAQEDDLYAQRLANARRRGCVLRYVAVFTHTGDVRVELMEIERDHPFYYAQGNDNIISITTTRYRERPLVIQGPGAGPDVTASGVFSGILRTVVSSAIQCKFRSHPVDNFTLGECLHSLGHRGLKNLAHSLKKSLGFARKHF